MKLTKIDGKWFVYLPLSEELGILYSKVLDMGPSEAREHATQALYNTVEDCVALLATLQILAGWIATEKDVMDAEINAIIKDLDASESKRRDAIGRLINKVKVIGEENNEGKNNSH